jgi:hypothetical protein
VRCASLVDPTRCGEACWGFSSPRLPLPPIIHARPWPPERQISSVSGVSGVSAAASYAQSETPPAAFSAAGGGRGRSKPIWRKRSTCSCPIPLNWPPIRCPGPRFVQAAKDGISDAGGVVV